MTRNIKQMDLTEGPIFRKLLLFALPFLGSSLIQEMYSMVDVMIIGKFIGTEASAAASSGTDITSLLLKIFSGIGVGVGIAVARAYGAKNDTWISEIVHTVALATMVSSVALTAAGIFMTRQLLIMMNTPDNVLDAATVYMRIYFLSIFAAIFYNMANGILSALGDSASTLLYQIIGGAVNVAGDAVMCFVFHAGINGIAAASVLAEAAAAVLAVARLRKLPEAYRLSGRKLHINPGALKEVLRLGIPSAMQSGLVSFCNLTVQAQINSLGTLSIAAFSAYFQVENFICYPIGAVGSAYVTFVGQNSGAGRYDRLKKGLRTSLFMSVIVSCGLTAVVLALGTPVFGMFTSDPEVRDLAFLMALRSYPFYFLFSFYDIYGADMRGRRITLPPMILSLTCMVGLRLAVLFYIMSRGPDPAVVVILYPITWAAVAVSFFLGRLFCIEKGKYEPEVSVF